MKQSQVYSLDQQLCFTLYACSREFTKMYRPVLEPLGLTYTQYIVLLALWEKDGITVNDLGAKLFLDSGTLTPLLKRMESMGWLTRQRSHEDERRVLIYLTDRGNVLQSEVCMIPQQLLQGLNYTAEELGILLQELRRLLFEVHQRNDKK